MYNLKYYLVFQTSYYSTFTAISSSVLVFLGKHTRACISPTTNHIIRERLSEVTRLAFIIDATKLPTTYLRCKLIFNIIISQLYGSTTVVMAIYGLHWKCRSLTPCQRHPSEPIEKIFGTIDHVIDLNNLAKFGFGKIFRDWGTYTYYVTYKGLCFFFFFFFFSLFNFLRSLTRVQPKRLNRFWCAISQTTPFG